MADLENLPVEICVDVWSPPWVEEAIFLYRWHLCEAETRDLLGGWHLVGRDDEGRECVSDALQHFDSETGLGITRSRQVFQLVGPPDYEFRQVDGQKIWGNWVAKNGQYTHFRDMTDKIYQKSDGEYNVVNPPEFGVFWGFTD